jgi:hypothetical protein
VIAGMAGASPLCVPVLACSSASSVASSLTHDAAQAVLSVVTGALVSAAAWLVGHVIQLVAGTGQIDLGQPWFLQRSEVMLQLLEFVVVPLLLAATIGPVLRQDLRRLARVWAVGLPVAVLVGLSGAQFTQLAVAATDELCQAIVGNPSTTLGGSLKGLVTAMVIPGAPQLVAALIACLLIIGSVLLWLELVVRAAAVYVAVFFMPLALACYVWPATAVVARRTVEMLAALILSKFVIVATLTLGVAALHGGPSADNAVVGSGILLIAGFAPFSLIRLVPIVEAGVGLVLASRAGGAHPPPATAVTPQWVGERPADYPTEAPGGPTSA